MKLNVFKVYSRSVHSYMLVLEAVTTTGTSVVGCNTLHCDPPPDLTYTVTLGGLVGDAGVFASNVIDTPDTPAAHNMTLIIAVGGSTVLTVTNDIGVAYTATPTLSGNTHVLGCDDSPTDTQYFAALAHLLDQLDDVRAVANGATSVTITADDKETSTYDIVVTGTAISGGHLVTTATAGLSPVNIWEAWNGTHVLTWRDDPGHLIGFPEVTGTNRNCNWYDSEKKIHLYPTGLSEYAQAWQVVLSATPEHKLTWGSPQTSFCDIPGNYVESATNFCVPALSAACVAQGSGATTCVVAKHSNAVSYNKEDTNIFVCFNDPETSSSGSSSSEESSSLGAVAADPLYQIYPNRTLVSIASLSDLDILPIDVPDDRLYRASTVAMLFHSLSQLEAVLASVISDAQVIARFQNYDIQVTETITSEDPLHDIDPGDLYNIP